MKSKKCIAWVVYSILLVVIAVVLVLVVRDNGIYPSGDDTFYHIYRGEYVYKSIKSGDFFPKLDKNWYNGVELMRFWPPMCAYVMAFLDMLCGGDIYAGYLAYIVVTFILSALSFAFIGERIIGGKIYNVIECTGSWERKILYSYVEEDGTRRHYKGGQKNGRWTKHGKMTAWLDYGNSAQTSANGANSSANNSKEEIIMPTIKKGSKGQIVKIWQVIIGVNVDGEFGPITDSKTRVFQKEHGLVVDGIVGKNTWKVGFDTIR